MKVGTGSSLMGCEMKVGLGTGASLHSRRERVSLVPLRTGVARPKAERRPKAGRRLRVCMTILCDRSGVSMFQSSSEESTRHSNIICGEILLLEPECLFDMIKVRKRREAC